MNPIYFFIGGLVLSIAWFRMDLLIKSESFVVILVMSSMLFCLGTVLILVHGASYASGALLCPLLTLGLFRIFRNLFLRLVGREPRDTLLDWSSGIAADSLFNILYFTLAALILIFVPFLTRRIG
jgi:hypothetical protein